MTLMNKNEAVPESEVVRRQRISASIATSDRRKAQDAKLRGVSRGPDIPETRAAKIASHRASRETRAWYLWYDAALAIMEIERERDDQLAALDELEKENVNFT